MPEFQQNTFYSRAICNYHSSSFGLCPLCLRNTSSSHPVSQLDSSTGPRASTRGALLPPGGADQDQHSAAGLQKQLHCVVARVLCKNTPGFKAPQPATCSQECSFTPGDVYLVSVHHCNCISFCSSLCATVFSRTHMHICVKPEQKLCPCNNAAYCVCQVQAVVHCKRLRTWLRLCCPRVKCQKHHISS